MAAEAGAIAVQVGEADPDVALLQRYASGDQSAARELTTKHAGHLLGLATRMLRDSAEAEDVVQETMLRAWKVAANWEPGRAKFSTWLHRVALNLCYDRLRKKRPAGLDEAPEPEDDRPTAQMQMEQSERSELLAAAIADLPDRQRAAIQLSHFEGQSNPDTAAALEISVEAVESLLARGRRALRQRLEAHRALLMEG